MLTPNEILENILLYPNPASDTINLRIDDRVEAELRYSIYNRWGKVMRDELLFVDKKVPYIHTIDVSDLVPGTYFMTLRYDTLAENKRAIYIVKEN